MVYLVTLAPNSTQNCLSQTKRCFRIYIGNLWHFTTLCLKFSEKEMSGKFSRILFQFCSHYNHRSVELDFQHPCFGLTQTRGNVCRFLWHIKDPWIFIDTFIRRNQKKCKVYQEYVNFEAAYHYNWVFKWFQFRLNSTKKLNIWNFFRKRTENDIRKRVFPQNSYSFPSLSIIPTGCNHNSVFNYLDFWLREAETLVRYHGRSEKVKYFCNQEKQ